MDSVQKKKKITVDLPTGPVHLCLAPGMVRPPASTIRLAELLDVKPGERILELGCGSGLLSIVAARLGAEYVLATDLNPTFLDATLHNASCNGFAHRIDIAAGSWYDAIPPVERRKGFDLIIAMPPQTPGCRFFGPKYGGFDGTKHLFEIVDGASLFLKPKTGRMWILAISLANPRALLQRLGNFFDEVEIIKESERFFSPEEYDGYSFGLFAHLLALRKQGRCEFLEKSPGSWAFRNLFILARGPRAT